MMEATKTARDPSTAFRGLGVVRDLFARLHDGEVAYCHWKSNEHLGPAAEGLTDLDVLVEPRRSADLQRILAQSGFRRFAAPSLRAYPAIEDYLALDRNSGRLVHLHLHHQLTLGERHLKSYRLPWEARLLASRRLEPAHGIYVVDPAYESVLLLVRAALKHRLRDRLRRRSGSAAPPAENDFLRELAWLRRQVDDATVRDAARDLLGPAADEPLQRVLAESGATARLAALAAAIRSVLRRHRTYGRGEARLRAWLRELQWVADVVNRRYLHRPTPLRRVSPRGGTIVVLLGPDGAGKSTLARALIAWLGVKLDVVPIYFGSGDGPGAIYRWPMKLAYRLLRRVLGPAQDGGRAGVDARARPTLRSRLRAAARVPWAIALSCEKRAKLRRMVRARNRGMVVVCDRFPQHEFPGFNDGPLLAHWREHPHSICRALAAWEARPYAEAALDASDLVIKLTVSPAVAQARRPEMSLTELRRRIAAVDRLRFPSARVLKLDADQPFDVVALRAKQAVWDHL